jgi:hypothetical protein
MGLNKLLVPELARCEYILRRESIGLAVRQRGLAGCLHDRGFACPSVIEGRDEIRASWTVESGPAVMKKARRSQSEKVFGTHKGLSLRQRGMPLNQGMAPPYQHGTQ